MQLITSKPYLKISNLVINGQHYVEKEGQINRNCRLTVIHSLITKYVTSMTSTFSSSEGSKVKCLMVGDGLVAIRPKKAHSLGGMDGHSHCIKYGGRIASRYV